MTKKLQKKFIVTSMTAIGILLLVLTLALNVFNASSQYRQNKRVLDMLCEKEFSILWQIPQEFGQWGDSGFLQPPVDENTRRSSIYFIAYADKDKNIRFIDTSRSVSITKAEAEKISLSAVSSGTLTGKIGAYRYKAVATQSNIGTAYVFLDTTQSTGTVLRVILFSIFAALACILLMLPVTVMLSKKAIKPIAVNMEKQKNFVTDAGHEIKTPLAIIMANTEALELHTQENKWTRNIKEQTNRLSILTQDLLALSRLDDAETDKIHEEVSFSEIVSDTIAMFYESAALKGVMINENIRPDITLKADREHLTRLVSVLTDNAVKYCSEKSEITLSLDKKDKKTVFTVSNVCDALPGCESEKLFDRFYRGDSSHTQKSGGCGIGLSAARAIVELYKGKITALYGEGNTITFTVTI